MSISGFNTPGAMITYGDNIYVLNNGTNTVSVIDIETNTIINTITVGNSPNFMVAQGSTLYVANSADDTVSYFDMTSPPVLPAPTVSVGDFPNYMITHGDTLYIACGNGTLSYFDMTSPPPTASSITLGLASDQNSMVIYGGTLYVSSFGTNEVYAVDMLTNTFSSISVGNSPNSMIANGRTLYVAYQGGVVRIDMPTNSAGGAIAIGLTPNYMVIHGDMLYVACNDPGTDKVFIITMSTAAVTSVDIGSLYNPSYMVTYGNTLYVANTDVNTISAIDMATNVVTTAFSGLSGPKTMVTYGTTLYIANTVGSTVSVLNLPVSSGTSSITLTNNPRGTMISYGDTLYAIDYANPFTNGNVNAINMTTGVVTSISVGLEPVYMVTYGNKLYVANAGDQSISVIDMPANTLANTIALPISPNFMVIYGATMYVTTLSDNNVRLIDLTTDTFPGVTITVGNGSIYMVIYGETLFVLDDGGQVYAIDIPTNNVSFPIPVGSTPTFMIPYGNTLFVSNSGSANVSVIDMTTQIVAPSPITVQNGPTYMVTYGNNLYVLNEQSHFVSVIDMTVQLPTSYPVGGTPLNLITFGNNLLLAGTPTDKIGVFDMRTNSLSLTTFAVGTRPSSMVIYGDRLFVANTNGASVSAVGLSALVCYVEGTKILTKNGYKAIEDIQVEDMVVTKGTIRNSTFVKHPQQHKAPIPVWKSALSRQTNKPTLTLTPVVWTGYFTVNIYHDESRPICIKAHAFGQDKPFEDLYVSSGHRIITPTGFQKAGELVNGTTIVRDYSRTQVKYYHIELKDHSAIIANGLEAESYEDVNNRRTFGYQPKRVNNKSM